MLSVPAVPEQAGEQVLQAEAGHVRTTAVQPCPDALQDVQALALEAVALCLADAVFRAASAAGKAEHPERFREDPVHEGILEENALPA